MILLATLACMGAPVPDVPDAGQARVVTHAGAVTAGPSGALRPVTDDPQLDASDLVHTEPDSFVVLLLPNRYLVRVDEELELAVQELALWDRPPTEVDPAAQLDALFYADEATLRSDASERIAGWDFRVQTAERAKAEAPRKRSTSARPTRAPASEIEMDEASTASEPVAASDAGGGEFPPSPPRAIGFGGSGASPPPPPAKGAGSADGHGLELGEITDEPAVRGEEELAPHSEEAPARVPPPAVRTCLAKWKREAPWLPDEVEIRFSVDAAGNVNRVFTTDGLPLPTCLREAVVGKPPELPSTWKADLTAQ